ncbi:unnamed protein product [Nippostrongylus brasiliensis]|uniref:Ig-like domain-containing protein n=1 Tax=Nippostrongylus brasiliensis TaxID=27835 RepID=A0A3P7BMA1_NIPBR|nr:unnamed protein product [Nippostrongylus brasiliensis]
MVDFADIVKFFPLICTRCSIHALRTASPTVPVDFSSNPCPVVLGCSCIGQDITNVECFGIANSVSQLLQQYPSFLNLDLFSDFKSLAKLAVTVILIVAALISSFCVVSCLLYDFTGHITLLIQRCLCILYSIREAQQWCRNVNYVIFKYCYAFPDISYNPLVETDFPDFVSLEWLDLSGTKFNVAPRIKAPLLRELVMDRSNIEMIDFRLWTLPNLRRYAHCFALSTFFLLLPEPLKYLNVSESNFDCDSCVMQWSVPVTSLITNQTKYRFGCSAPQANCSLGISQHDPEIVRAEMGKSVILPCTAYGTPEPTVEWWVFLCDSLLMAFFIKIFICHSSGYLIVSGSSCSVLGGGALLLHNVNRSTVERYVCVVRQNKASVQRIVHFRLDYASWYSLDLFSSVFWGGIATAILACSFSFLLNITWILTRKSILWWINRAERLSRVRKMVEAMEKYRTRQMEGLQAKYARRMQLVRENYHAQVEQLRLSYSSQAEKFRDYRAAQMEQMSSHLENIRENYNQQMQRVREYGSRRAEQLWESYERQVNRMKAFSLQHRLKMMRQYKVKQRYLNKLLESLQDSTANPEVIRQQEEEVRAALEMPAPPVSPTDPLPLSRSSSFYSLPEYIIDNDGILRPSPIIGRFSSNLRSNDIGNRRSTGASSHNGKSADEPGSSGL